MFGEAEWPGTLWLSIFLLAGVYGTRGAKRVATLLSQGF
jgi:hypothetical protein